MPGMPGIPGPQGRREEMELKDRLVIRGRRECLQKKGEKGNEGPRGKSGPPGMMGIKGTQGTLGDEGIKGDKGEKGETATSPSSAVPQTNWKQCVWKNLNDDRDSGKIKVRSERDVLTGIGRKQSYFLSHHGVKFKVHLTPKIFFR